MKQNNELAPMSVQERKEDIDMLMKSEMMDATIGGKCDSCSSSCADPCKKGCAKDNRNTTVIVIAT
jgi:hypothetical protein